MYADSFIDMPLQMSTNRCAMTPWCAATKLGLQISFGASHQKLVYLTDACCPVKCLSLLVYDADNLMRSVVQVVHDKTQEKKRLEALIAQNNLVLQQHETLKENARTTRSGPGRAEKMAKLGALKQQERELDELLESLKMNDPELIANIHKQTATNVASANRWTDNIWALKKFLVKKRGMSGKEVSLACDALGRCKSSYLYALLLL